MLWCQQLSSLSTLVTDLQIALQETENGQLITLVSASLTKCTSDDGLGLMESRGVYFNVSSCHGTWTHNGTYTELHGRIGRANMKEV
jgi:hypothetical protein